MMTFEKLTSEKYLSDSLKNNAAEMKREADRAEVCKLAVYTLSMTVMVATLLLYLSADSWVPALQQQFRSWGLSQWNILPW